MFGVYAIKSVDYRFTRFYNVLEGDSAFLNLRGICNGISCPVYIT